MTHNLAIVLCVIRITASPFEKGTNGEAVSFGHCIVCHSNYTQYNGHLKKDKWGSCNSNDTQYNGQMKRDKCIEAVIRMTASIQWPNEKVIRMGKLSPFVPFHLAIVLCVIRITAINGHLKKDKFGHCIVCHSNDSFPICPFSWPLYCVSFE